MGRMACPLALSGPPVTPPTAPAEAASDERAQQAAPSDSTPSAAPWPTLDRLGLTQAIGGLVLGLIALFSSYDHITLAGTSVRLQQQWGVLFIVASVATVLVDAQLASRSRLREAHERLEERQTADRERNRAAQARDRTAEGAQLQARCLVAQSRFLLADTARSRLQLSEAVALLMEQLRLG